MGWLHHTLDVLNGKFAVFESRQDDGSFSDFHHEVKARIDALKEELKDLGSLDNDAYWLMQEVKKVLDVMENIHFDHEDTYSSRGVKYRGFLKKTYRGKIEEIEASLGKMQRYVGHLERTVKLVKKEQELAER